MTDHSPSCHFLRDEILEIGRQPPVKVLFSDKAIIAVNKFAGQLFHGLTNGLPTSLVDQIKELIKKESGKSGNVYLGVVNRIDRPVSGLTVFARNSKFAGRMSEQFSQRTVKKSYLALVQGALPSDSEQWIDELQRLSSGSDESAGPQECRLSFEVVSRSENHSLVDINLQTGRRHQIRRQFSLHGFPVVGDTEYGAQPLSFSKGMRDQRFCPIALHSYSLNFSHPLSYENMEIRAPVPHYWRHLLREFGVDHSAIEFETVNESI